MGWIATRVRSLTHGMIDAETEVEESPGFDGERVTPSGQQYKTQEQKFTIPRRNRTVWATREEAMNAYEEARAARGH